MHLVHRERERERAQYLKKVGTMKEYIGILSSILYLKRKLYFKFETLMHRVSSVHRDGSIQ